MDKLTAPRELTPEKMEELRGLLRAELLENASASADAAVSPADEEDADMLLDYATDMIEGDENVGHVIEELKFMEMPLCDEEVAFNLGVIMMKYFVELEMAGSGGASGGEADAEEPAEEPEPEPEPEPEGPEGTSASAEIAGASEDAEAKEEEPPPPEIAAPVVETAPPPPPPPAQREEATPEESKDAAVAEPDDEPSEKLTPLEERELQKRREKEEKEARIQEQKKDLPSLKQRMAAFQGGAAEGGGAAPPPPEPLASSAGRMSWIKAEPREKAPEKKEPTPKAVTAGRKSWKSAKDSAGAAKAATPEKSSSEREPKQPQKQEQKGASLKQRLAAYQNASTRGLPQEPEEEPAEGGDAAPKEGAGEVEPPPSAVDAAPIRLSLKQRMAAFQGGGAEAMVPVEEEASSAAASAPEEEEDQGIDDTPISMKDRLAAYQRRMAATEEEGGGEETEEAKPKARAPAKDPAREEKRRSLQDRMAAFGGAAVAPKPKPKKEASGVQQRMAMFSSKPSPAASATGGETAGKGPPPRAKGGGSSALRERLAKYAETAGMGDPETFVAPKKTTAAAKAKRRTFTAKKPKGGLQSRMQAFQGAAAAEGAGDEKEPPKEAVPEGDKKEQKKWKYQSKGPSASRPTPPAGPEAVANGSPPPVAAAPERPPAVDLKARLSLYQANAGTSPAPAAGRGVAGSVGAGDPRGRAAAGAKDGEAAGAVPSGGAPEGASGDDADARDPATASGDAAAPLEAVGKENDVENEDLDRVPAQDETPTPAGDAAASDASKEETESGLGAEGAMAAPIDDAAPPDAIPDERVVEEDDSAEPAAPSGADLQSFHDFEQLIATPIEDVAPQDAVTDERVGEEEGLSKPEDPSETSAEDLQSFEKFRELIATPVEDAAP